MVIKFEIHKIHTRTYFYIYLFKRLLKSIFIKCFLKLFKPTSCLIMSGNAFHILGAKYLHDFKPCLVELILGSVKISLPHRLYVAVLR